MPTPQNAIYVAHRAPPMGIDGAQLCIIILLFSPVKFYVFFAFARSHNRRDAIRCHTRHECIAFMPSQSRQLVYPHVRRVLQMRAHTSKASRFSGCVVFCLPRLDRALLHCVVTQRRPGPRPPQEGMCVPLCPASQPVNIADRSPAPPMSRW